MSFGIGDIFSGALSSAGQLFGANTLSGANQQAGLAGILAAQGAQQAIASGTKKATAVLQPYNQAGQQTLQELLQYLQGSGALNAGIGGGGANLLSTFQPTMDQLAATPGYQWALDQGLRAAQGGYAAQGMGRSGNAMAGAVNYAQGLASTTYQQQLQNYMSQNLRAYNMLMGPSQLGGNAAGQQANTIMTGAQAQANAMMAQGQIAGASAIGQAAPYANAYANMGNTLGGLAYGLNSPSGGSSSPYGLPSMNSFASNPLGYIGGAAAQFGSAAAGGIGDILSGLGSAVLAL